MLSLTRNGLNQMRKYSTSVAKDKDSYYLVVVGGGAGGLSIAAKFTEVLKVLDKGKVAVIEPTDVFINHFNSNSTDIKFIRSTKTFY